MNLTPRELIKNALDEGRSKLYDHEAFKLLELSGFPVPKTGLAKNLDEAVKIAESIGYPVVLKIVSPQVIHKSDVGGVLLNIKSPKEVSEGFNKIINNVKTHIPDAEIYGILVQEMLPQGLETIVGSTKDPVFGNIMVFGLGGIFVEVLRDVSFRIAPVEFEEAFEMVNEIKSSKILSGFRGSLPRDKKALAEVIVKLSKLVTENPEIREVDLNPVMVYEEGKGAKIADARFIISK
ncbi:MAG: acetate--CoA ligase family protein [Sulfolobales archaeon]